MSLPPALHLRKSDKMETEQKYERSSATISVDLWETFLEGVLVHGLLLN